MVDRIYTPEDANNKIKSYRDVKSVIDNYGRNSMEYINDITLVLKHADIFILLEIKDAIRRHRFDYLKDYKKSFIENSIMEREQKYKSA